MNEQVWYMEPMIGDDDDLGSDETAEAFRAELQGRYGNTTMGECMGLPEITIVFPSRAAAEQAEVEVLRLALERPVHGCGVVAEVGGVRK